MTYPTVDMSKKVFGSLKPIRIVCRDRKKANALGLSTGANWLCRCDCGRYKIASGRHMRQGKVSSCGCARVWHDALDVAGERYGRLLALRRDTEGGKGKNQGAHWFFLCDCCKLVSLRLKDVRSGNTLSCGCLKNQHGAKYGEPKIEASRPWRRQ